MEMIFPPIFGQPDVIKSIFCEVENLTSNF